MPAERDARVLVRYRVGTAPESARVVHVLPELASDGEGRLVAVCGREFSRNDRLELMEPGQGMPCVLCLLA